MTTNSLRNLGMGLCAAILIAGCDSKNDPGENEGSGEASTSEGETGDTDDPSATTTDTPDTESEGDSGSEEDTGCIFLCPETDTGPEPDCDVWTQDCPEGEKCAPWANDGGNSWNSAKCVPVDDQPDQPGDSCTVEGSGVSGLDSCDTSAMCWGVDGETNTGTCVAFCHGSDAAPLCDDPATSCVIANDGVLILCLPTCDPLAPGCSETEACYPINDSFACAPDASGPMQGAYGDPCEFTNSCDPGLFCANADVVPNCNESNGCCSEFCDLAAPGGDGQCQGQAGGQQCLPWFDEGNVPPGFIDLGACAIPTQ